MAHPTQASRIRRPDARHAPCGRRALLCLFPGRSGRPAVLKRADTIHSGGRSDFRPPLLYTHKHGKTYRHRHTPPARNGTAGSIRPRWARLRRVRSPGIQPRGHRRIPPLCRTGNTRGTAPQRVEQSWGAFRQGKLIGIITLTRRSHLCLLFVEKACHRQGIARALFSALRDHCRTAPGHTSDHGKLLALRRRSLPQAGIPRDRRRTHRRRHPVHTDGIPIYIKKNRAPLGARSKYLPWKAPAYFAGAVAGAVAVESAGAGSS